jgi:two-component system, LytTR family, sensor histidine kinase AlgZ
MGSINQNRPPIALPDFCNLGIVLRILLPTLAACGLFAMLVAPASPWDEFVTDAAVLQPLLLGSIALLCALRPALGRLESRHALAAVCLAEVGLCILNYYALARFFPGIHSAAVWQHVVATLALTCTLLFYLALRAQALSPAISEARLQALQARIRPHFLFNSITAVLSLIREDPKRAETALEDMADLFRVLMADNRELAPLEDEIALCRKYLALEQLRLGDRLRVAWHTEKMPHDALVPPLVLQPLLENAVYHGIEPAQEPGEVSINVYRNRHRVIAVLRNPYHASGGSHHAGNKMALSNIRERLALHFDVEASLTAQVVGNAYQVTIILPYTARPA